MVNMQSDKEHDVYLRKQFTSTTIPGGTPNDDTATKPNSGTPGPSSPDGSTPSSPSPVGNNPTPGAPGDPDNDPTGNENTVGALSGLPIEASGEISLITGLPVGEKSALEDES